MLRGPLSRLQLSVSEETVAASGGVSWIEVHTHSVPYICTISFEEMARLSGNSHLCPGELGSLEA